MMPNKAARPLYHVCCRGWIRKTPGPCRPAGGADRESGGLGKRGDLGGGRIIKKKKKRNGALDSGVKTQYVAHLRRISLTLADFYSRLAVFLMVMDRFLHMLLYYTAASLARRVRD